MTTAGHAEGALFVEASAPLSGSVVASPSKSHTLRALLFASLANGRSSIGSWLRSPDTQAMVRACQLLGARIEPAGDRLVVEGVAAAPCIPDDVIHAGNSGQVLRFVAAIGAHLPGYMVLTGDHSIRHRRPLAPLIEGLKGLGAFALSTKGDGHAPLVVGGPWQCGTTECDGDDSQPVSALLIASAFARGLTKVSVRQLGEKPWVGLTLHWLRRLGVEVDCRTTWRGTTEISEYAVQGRGSDIRGFDYDVPGDFSSIAFPVAAALITGGALTIHGVDLDDVQGDKAVLDVMRCMGAKLHHDAVNKTLFVQENCRLSGVTADINDHIDSICVLSALACFAQGRTVLSGAAIARSKESDRIAVMATQLARLGATIQPTDDGLVIDGDAPLRGAVVEACDDHRVAMALALAGLGAAGRTTVRGTDCIGKSYASFVSDMNAVGARMAPAA